MAAVSGLCVLWLKGFVICFAQMLETIDPDSVSCGCGDVCDLVEVVFGAGKPFSQLQCNSTWRSTIALKMHIVKNYLLKDFGDLRVLHSLTSLESSFSLRRLPSTTIKVLRNIVVPSPTTSIRRSGVSLPVMSVRALGV